MKRFLYTSFKLVIIVFLCCSCSENNPEGLVPQLTVDEAQSVTRYAATLNGHITLENDRTTVTSLRFRYGDNAQMLLSAPCTTDTKDVSTSITQLTSGTTYYYCLEAGNEYSTIESDAHTFTTLPDSKPSLSDIKVLARGPISAILQFDINDNGGKKITEAGFYYQTDGAEKKKLSASVTPSDTTIRMRIGELQSNTSYRIWAYAKNAIGETETESITLQNGNITQLAIAGVLSEAIGESDKYTTTTLNIAGPLNGSDLRFIRAMAGKDIDDTDTPGTLTALNMTDAHIVAGGLSYNSSRFSAPDTIGYGLFKDCVRLTSVILPDDAKVMEENAFYGCTSLTTIQIPTSMLQLSPSIGCTSLSAITISAANNNYCSIEGVLYNKDVTNILWYPQGKDDTSFTLPSSVKQLSNYAFHSCKLHAIVLPSAIATLPYGVFQNSTNLSSVTLGSSITLLSQYCFSGCPLTQLHVKAMLPPVANNETFAGVNDIYSTCTLYVPIGCKSIYSNSWQWGKFTKIIEE
jgi:hypothetical protein